MRRIVKQRGVPKQVDHYARRLQLLDALWRITRREGWDAITLRHLGAEAGRWYLLAHHPADGRWRVHRVDRLHVYTPTGVRFDRRELPAEDLADYVMTRHDRGDLLAEWPCTGVVVLHRPAELVARFAPGGSVVEYVAPNRTRLTLGAWSWAGVAGILATFDADLEIVEPEELRKACHDMAARYAGV